MINFGIQVYFIEDNNFFQKLRLMVRDKKQRPAFRAVLPTRISENQQQQKNFFV